MIRYIVSVLVCFGMWIDAGAAGNERDAEAPAIVASLLSCTPGPEVYALYGHTAIRLRYTADGGGDYVFNYGMFNQRDKYFAWNFTLGRTDYKLGVVPYEAFAYEYHMRGLGVTEQVLNLTPQEVERLAGFLMRNALPENCVYRYNYFYKNCTTMSRDAIESIVDGRVVYDEGSPLPYGTTEPMTFRKLVHIYTAGNPWIEFGQDLLLGSEADAAIDMRLSMFAPLFMMKYAAEATIVDNGTTRPLVSAEMQIIPTRYTPATAGWFTPTVAACALFLIYIMVWLCEWRTGRRYWAADALLLGTQGAVGVVVAFMFFFSTHPTVGSNVLVAILNPLPLIYLPREIFMVIKRRRDAYHAVAGAVILLFSAASLFFLQYISPAMWILVLTLLCHSIIRYRYAAKGIKQDL